jgi:hypothetical protein
MKIEASKTANRIEDINGVLNKMQPGRFAREVQQRKIISKKDRATKLGRVAV